MNVLNFLKYKNLGAQRKRAAFGTPQRCAKRETGTQATALAGTQDGTRLSGLLQEAVDHCNEALTRQMDTACVCAVARGLCSIMGSTTGLQHIGR